MLRWLRSQLRERGYLLPPMPERDDVFVAMVREHFDAPCRRHGFAFNAASVGMGSGPTLLQSGKETDPPLVRETTVLYEADARVFCRTYAQAGSVSPEDGCVDLWICLDADRGTTRVDLDGADPLDRLRSIAPAAAERLDVAATDQAFLLASRAEALDEYLERARG